MSSLVYLVDWLPPEYGAIGQYALQEATARAAQGDSVILVGLTSGPSSLERQVHGAGELTVRRLHSRPLDRSGLKRRAAWTLETNLRLVGAALPSLLAADEVLFTASPPFLEHFIVPLRPLIRGKVIFRVADLHPECLMAELPSVPAWLEAFQRISVLLRRHADVVEVLGEDQRRRLLSQGVDPARVVLRRSGAPVAVPPGTRPLELPAELEQRCVLLYSGAVSQAHDIDTFVEGYRRHHASGSGRVGFWLNAAGGRADEFEQAVRSRRLPLARSAPVPLAQLASLLVTPAAHLITLRDSFVGLVVPSKVYGCVESGRDILYVGSSESDVDLMCRQGAQARGGYARVEVGDPAGVAHALEELADRHARRAGAKAN